ncbi:MAG TPA: FRG domain-containing protein [Candidatus Sulfotelmatobacter sp.]|nr:FRG domain-containing protein [Candidatus Sulfotelmatobacter sp.]
MPVLQSDVHVSNWSELQVKLYEDSWQPSLKRFRSPFAFRGLSNSSFIPETTLTRLGGEYHLRERSLLRNFRKYAHRSAIQRDSLWNWISLGQHHGLPSRLLDWSFSPYVALHFATVNRAEWANDAMIWCVDCVKIKKYLPAKLQRSLKEADSDVLTVEMLDQVAPTLHCLERLSKKPFVAFFEPPSLDDRIIHQAALFSVSSRADLSVSQWFYAHREIFHRIIIPAQLKQEIRDKLDQANINERTLFPGLDGLSLWLTRYYSPTLQLPVSRDFREGVNPSQVLGTEVANMERRQPGAAAKRQPHTNMTGQRRAG